MPPHQAPPEWIESVLKKFHNPLPHEEERRLLFLSRSKNDIVANTAREMLVLSNMRFGINHARSLGYLWNKRELTEQLSCIASAIIEAINRFDLTRTTKLITYAARWVEREIKNDFALRHYRNATYVPPLALKARAIIEKAASRIQQEKHRTPQREEIAASIRATEARVAEVQSITFGALSLDDFSDTKEKIPVSPKIALKLEQRTFQNQFDILLREELQARVGAACTAFLTPREQHIIYLRFFGGKTLKETALYFGVSENRIHQIEVEAKKKLAEGLASFASELKLTKKPPEEKREQHTLPYSA